MGDCDEIHSFPLNYYRTEVVFVVNCLLCVCGKACVGIERARECMKRLLFLMTGIVAQANFESNT